MAASAWAATCAMQTRVTPRRKVAWVEGNARAILRAERVAWNLVQRMSGTATLAGRFTERVSHLPHVRILDTRKTTPGLRVLEKYAVRCGGAENHRIGLYDEAMLKDNHIELAGSTIEAALARLRQHVGEAVRITAEARNGEEAQAAIRGGADVVLLDNFTPGLLREWCPKLRALAQQLGVQVELEASGGIVLENVRAYGEAGVDRISVGALTHSAPALDFSLELEPLR
ncbi:MAG: carboxylating nicotinate-nucleotide diphosphorylase [Planctomycetota bacterium]